MKQAVGTLKETLIGTDRSFWTAAERMRGHEEQSDISSE